jgi:hypothetical protein
LAEKLIATIAAASSAVLFRVSKSGDIVHVPNLAPLRRTVRRLRAVKLTGEVLRGRRQCGTSRRKWRSDGDEASDAAAQNYQKHLAETVGRRLIASRFKRSRAFESLMSLSKK